MVVDGNKSTFYEVLGIKEDATPLEIKRTYRKLAQKYHPDGTNPDTEKFKEFSEAYTTLADPKKREVYDRELHFYRMEHGSNKHAPAKAKPALNHKKGKREEAEDFENYYRSQQFREPPKRKPGQTQADFRQEQAAFERYFQDQQPKPPKQTQQTRQSHTVFSSRTMPQGRPITGQPTQPSATFQADLRSRIEEGREKLRKKTSEAYSQTQQPIPPQHTSETKAHIKPPVIIEETRQPQTPPGWGVPTGDPSDILSGAFAALVAVAFAGVGLYIVVGVLILVGWGLYDLFGHSLWLTIIMVLLIASVLIYVYRRFRKIKQS